MYPECLVLMSIIMQVQRLGSCVGYRETQSRLCDCVAPPPDLLSQTIKVFHRPIPGEKSKLNNLYINILLTGIQA